MKRSPGFTITEVLVATAILALLAGIAWPVFSRVREAGQRTTCLSNARQLGLAMSLYREDYNDKYAIGRRSEDHWFRKILPYGDRIVAVCPMFVEGPYFTDSFFSRAWAPLPRGYAQNGCIAFAQVRKRPMESPMILFAEVAELSTFIREDGVVLLLPLDLSGPDAREYAVQQSSSFGPYFPVPIGGVFGAERHRGGANYVLIDTSARWRRIVELRLPAIGYGCISRTIEWQGPEDGPRFAIHTRGVSQ